MSSETDPLVMIADISSRVGHRRHQTVEDICGDELLRLRAAVEAREARIKWLEAQIKTAMKFDAEIEARALECCAEKMAADPDPYISACSEQVQWEADRIRRNDAPR